LSCRLAIVSSHPIQYNAPAFKALARDSALDVRVFYSWEGPRKTPDREFGRTIDWDIPLLEGYAYSFVPNRSANPGTDHFWGLDNPRMVDEIRSWNPDVVMVYGWSFSTHLKVMRAFKGRIPVLFRGDSTLLGKRSIVKSFMRRTMLKWIFSHVDMALYAGTRNREYFLEMGLRESQLCWAPHAVDNDRFTAGAIGHEEAATKWRERLEIPVSAQVFVFAGKLIGLKDPETLLRAFLENTRRESSNTHLVFAGDGNLRARLEAIAGHTKKVHFIGFQNQTAMPDVYRLGDALVLPSLSETWGLAVNEAMACSRPVIVSDAVGCAVDLVLPGKTGAIFRAGDQRMLSEALSNFGDLKESTRSMGENALELIEQWSIPVYAKAVASAVKRLSGSMSVAGSSSEVLTAG
jgi:glycosyltransferase involved in cell wall biosynthesis